MKPEKISRNKPTDLTAIRDFYNDRTNELVLTEHQEVKRERLIRAQGLLSCGMLNTYIVSVLMKDYGISHAQAYRDIRDGIILYGDLRKADKEGLRYIIYDMALETYQIARANGNVKQMNAAVTNMKAITGVDRLDPDLPDFDKLQPNVYPIVLDDRLNQMLEQLLKTQGVINLSKFMNQNAEDAEHEDLTGRTDPEGDQESPREGKG